MDNKDFYECQLDRIDEIAARIAERELISFEEFMDRVIASTDAIETLHDKESVSEFLKPIYREFGGTA